MNTKKSKLEYHMEYFKQCENQLSDYFTGTSGFKKWSGKAFYNYQKIEYHAVRNNDPVDQIEYEMLSVNPLYKSCQELQRKFEILKLEYLDDLTVKYPD